MNITAKIPRNLAELPQTQIGSMLVRAINNPNNQPNVAQIWMYYPISSQFIVGTLEAIDQLIAKGWQEAPSVYQTPLYTQLHETIYVQSLSTNKYALWAHQDSIAYVERYPVALASEMEFDQKMIDTLSVTLAGMPSIPMLTPLPLPTSGMGGFILSFHNPDAKLAGYRISSLPDEAQERCNRIRVCLREIAGPNSRWIPQTPTHRLVLDPVACQRELNHLLTSAHLTQGKARVEIQEQIDNLQQAIQEVRQIIAMQSKPSYESDLKEVRQLMQDLAGDYYEYHQSLQKKAQLPLPDISSSHQTMIPSIEHMRGLAQSFGHATRSLWNAEENTEQLLETPNGARLAVRGENQDEQKALHQFIDGGMGAEGIKYMMVVMAAYYEQTGAIDRKADARVTLRQLLKFMGREDHADDLDEQRKLMHYILYMARTWITALDKLPEQEKRRGRPRRGYLEYTPLIVLEALGSDVRGGIRIPESIEFHLGKEYWDQMFGSHKHYFTLPTRLILSYDSKRQSQEICLAFYLANMINLNYGTFDVHFPVLLAQTGLRNQEEIGRGHDRTRDALITLYAIERLEKDLLIIRDPHTHIDTALAVEYYTGNTTKIIDGKEVILIADATLNRVRNAYRYIQALSPAELRAKKRVALQSLLEQVAHNAIKFKSGPLINPQITKRIQGLHEAVRIREQAQEAAQKRKVRRKKS